MSVKSERPRGQCVLCRMQTSRVDKADDKFRCLRCAGLLRAFAPLHGYDFDGALCQQVDPDLWFPEVGQDGSGAKRVCGRCPVQQACHDYAVEAGEQWGIWGGTTARQRRGRRKTSPPTPTEQGRTA